MKKITAGIWCVAIAGLLAGSCGTTSSTQVTSSWKAKESYNLYGKKVLVLGILDKRDVNSRPIKINMEQELANNLRVTGIDAVAASDAFSPKEFSDMTEEQALKRLRNDGYDAAMTIVLLDKSKEKYYQPGEVRVSPYAVYYDRFWGYYHTIYGRVYTPGYYNTSTSYFWESNLYNLSNDKLLYSVQSESFDPATYQGLSMEYARKIVTDMNKQGLIAKAM